MKIRRRKLLIYARFVHSDYARLVWKFANAKIEMYRYVREDPRAKISTPGTGNVFVDLGFTIDQALNMKRRSQRRMTSKLRSTR